MAGSSKLLIDEHPLQVIPSLAIAIGLNEAIVLQQVHYWLKIAEQAHDAKKYRDDCWWTYGSVDEWQANNFPFWSRSTIQRAFANLEEKGLLIAKKFNAATWDHTKWYTINYDLLNASIASNWNDGLCQNDAIDEPDLTGSNVSNQDNVNTETSSLKSSTTTPKQQGKIIDAVEAERIYRIVTGFMSVPSLGRDETIRRICDIALVKGDETADYLKPFALVYSKTRSKETGAFYKVGTNGWLDWAAEGKVPDWVLVELEETVLASLPEQFQAQAIEAKHASEKVKGNGKSKGDNWQPSERW